MICVDAGVAGGRSEAGMGWSNQDGEHTPTSRLCDSDGPTTMNGPQIRAHTGQAQTSGVQPNASAFKSVFVFKRKRRCTCALKSCRVDGIASFFKGGAEKLTCMFLQGHMT